MKGEAESHAERRRETPELNEDRAQRILPVQRRKLQLLLQPFELHHPKRRQTLQFWSLLSRSALFKLHICCNHKCNIGAQFWGATFCIILKKICWHSVEFSPFYLWNQRYLQYTIRCTWYILTTPFFFLSPTLEKKKSRTKKKKHGLMALDW